MSETGRLRLAAVLLTLGGCAHAPQEARIDPQLDMPAGTAAAGQPLALAVRDERTRKLIGRRGDAMGAAAAITAPPDLVPVIRAAVGANLRAQGFAVRPAEAGGRRDGAETVPFLKISLRELSYESHNKILAGYSITASAFLAVRVRSGTADFEQSYSSEKSRDAFPTPTASANNGLINAVLSDALGQALRDPELQASLRATPARGRF